MIITSRFHLLELGDQPWCPEWLREHSHMARNQMWRTRAPGTKDSPAVQVFGISLQLDLENPRHVESDTVRGAGADELERAVPVDHLHQLREQHGMSQKSPPATETYTAQLTSIFVLEFGIAFHSVFIGLTLAVSGSEFTTLYIVIVFHQTFEGLGLGSRLAN